MAEYEIIGGKKLCGEYTLQRAKNSALAIMCASVMCRGETYIEKCPNISDVFTLSKILKRLGAVTETDSGGLYIDARNVYLTTIPEKLSEKLRASLFLVGPLIARFKSASFFSPGGCSIGTRPIDIHIDGLKALGAKVGHRENRLDFFAPKLTGGRIRLKYPSVGATENLMSCAVLAAGETVIENCAREPEIKDLQDYLNLCGAKIFGAGTGKITVCGVEKLHGGVSFEPIADRIEAGSLILAALAVGGEMTISGLKAENILNLTEKICDNACKISIYNDKIYIKIDGRPKGFGHVVTAPYPGFPTDLHPQLAACAATADGRTSITETVFDSRFKYVDRLIRFGADMRVEKDRVEITGKKLHGAQATATDLRGGMALVIAAMAAEGRSIIKDVSHIERGYERLPEKLSALGADVARL